MVHGTVVGDVKEGIPVDIYTVNCGIDNNLINSTVTNSEGNYSFSGLKDVLYLLIADPHYNSIHSWATVPQGAIESNDLILTAN